MGLTGVVGGRTAGHRRTLGATGNHEGFEQASDPIVRWPRRSHDSAGEKGQELGDWQRLLWCLRPEVMVLRPGQFPGGPSAPPTDGLDAGRVAKGVCDCLSDGLMVSNR